MPDDKKRVSKRNKSNRAKGARFERRIVNLLKQRASCSDLPHTAKRLGMYQASIEEEPDVAWVVCNTPIGIEARCGKEPSIPKAFRDADLRTRKVGMIPMGVTRKGTGGYILATLVLGDLIQILEDVYKTGYDNGYENGHESGSDTIG